jgi:beta-lactamase regulating signal transducer with metallopeptidase domain
MSLSSNEIVYALGWTLVHSLWQACLISIFVACTYAVTQKKSAHIRYWTNATALISCVIASLWTFYIYLGSTSSGTYQNDMEITATINQAASANTFYLSELINVYINQIVFIWLGGFLLYAVKYCSELIYCQHLKQHKNTQASYELEKKFIELKNCLGITKDITLCISTLVNIPCVVSHFKPMVLLPASILLKLSTQQIEAILLHELGHIKRNDYVISVLQNLMKSIYFFNPFIHWISLNMDEERENACDDIAVKFTGDPIFYANTLKEFTEINLNQSLTLNLTGRKNMLLNRIKRLFIKETSFSKTYGKTMAVMALFLVGAGFSISGYSTEDRSAKDVFTIKIDKEPLSNFLKLAQDFCPNIPKGIKLKHGDQLVSGDFANLRCEHTEAFIKNLDENLSKTFTGITINEDKISLKQLTQKIESACPEIKGKLSLSNPDKVVGFQTDNLNCGGIVAAIQQLDTNPDAKLINIKGAGDISIRTKTQPDVYTNAIPLRIPKESIDKVYLGECTALYSVDEKGKGFDITANCTNGKPEAKAFLEKQITTAIQNAQFPIKTENGKAVTVKGREFRLRLDPAKPINGEAAASQ